MGRVLDAIYKLAPDAMVIYTSDHGDMLGAHRLSSKNAAAYKEVANIPLIIRRCKGSGKCMRWHLTLILHQQLWNYFELPVPKKQWKVKSMLAQIMIQVLDNDAVFTEFTRYEVDHDGFGGLQMMRAITTKRYKLVIHLLDTDEFYDLETDPYEVENRINDEAYEAVRNELHDKLLAHMDDTRDLYRGYQWKMRPWRKNCHTRLE